MAHKPGLHLENKTRPPAAQQCKGQAKTETHHKDTARQRKWQASSRGVKACKKRVLPANPEQNEDNDGYEADTS